MSETTISFADVQGQPNYQIGLELGIFIFVTQNGRWHVRWNGNERGQWPITFFYLWGGDITAAKITNVNPYKFDVGQPDNFSMRRQLGNDVLNFNGVVFSDEDGLDFDVDADEVHFTLTGQIKDKEAFLYPGLIFLGANKINPTGTEFVVTKAVTPPPAPTPTLFWSNSGPANIQSAALTSAPSVATPVSMTYTAYGLALDPAGQKLYWSDSNASINTCNLDGSNVAALVSGMSFVAYGLALDLANNLAYCADPNPRGGNIWRVDLGTGQADKLVSGLTSPVDVALDLANGKIYWVEYGGGTVGCANIDGSGMTHPVSGLNYPQGIALDAASGILYWADKVSIQRAATDGSNVTLIVTTQKMALGNMLSRRVALDTTAAQVYWSDRGTVSIQRTSVNTVNGSGETVLANPPSTSMTSPTLLTPPLYPS